ncbi:protein of unknown function [Modestobacter italicus]|uniref:Uncharacterized protein n=1 Tax=Modestobacter italicus (strain DSM 44449 / CECT 9708 / BC 501) TaxID=2732864 RepID=I4F0F1_MODI5|nr:protein of unknown function [Modestobacter marinus]
MVTLALLEGLTGHGIAAQPADVDGPAHRPRVDEPRSNAAALVVLPRCSVSIRRLVTPEPTPEPGVGRIVDVKRRAEDRS